MANVNFYDRDNSESMIMHRPDSDTHYINEINSMEKQNGVKNNLSHLKNTDQGINVTDDISKTVEMLLVEEQYQQEITAKSGSRESIPDNSVQENIDIEMKDTKPITVHDASKCDLSEQKSPKKMKPNLICEICGSSVSRLTAMKQHLLAHTNLRPFSCKSCSFTFKDPVSLRRHVNTHNPDYIHLCDICGKSFSRREHLKNHKYLHTSNNPYICQTCNKQFTRSDHLMRHLLIHSGEKKFSCSYCEKNFGKRYQLTEHMYTHGKEKPLKCESCDYACVRPSELKQHMERVHVLGCDKRVLGTKKQDIEKPLKCVYCDFRCTGSLEFEQHRQCVHSLGELNYFKTRQSVAMNLIKSRIENDNLISQRDLISKETNMVKDNEILGCGVLFNDNSSMYLIGDAVYQEPQKQIQTDPYAHIQIPSYSYPETTIPYGSDRENAMISVPCQGMPTGLGQLEPDYETHNAVRNMLSQELTVPDHHENWGQCIQKLSNFVHENMMPVQNRIHQIRVSDSSLFKTTVHSVENENGNKGTVSMNEHKFENSEDMGNISDSTDCYDLSENKDQTETHNDLDNISDTTDNYDIENTLADDSLTNFGKADNDKSHPILTFPNMSSCIVTIRTNKATVPNNDGMERNDSDDLESNDSTINRKISIIIKTNQVQGQREQELNTASKDEVKKYLCDICGKHFSQRQSLRTHWHTHSEDFSYVCTTCNKQFNTKAKLTRHVRIHDPSSALLCESCGKSFSRADHLKSHKLLHLSESPYFCKICFKQFSRFDHLKRHMVSHSGEKKFSCEICFKTFSQNYNLKEHMYQHGIEKPIHCTSCERTFVKPSELKKHMMTHHHTNSPM